MFDLFQTSTGKIILSKSILDIKTGEIKKEAHWFSQAQASTPEFKAFVKKWVK